LGRAQAAELGRMLRDQGLARIVHSPLERARETATLINQQLAVPATLIPDYELRESEFSRYLQGVPFWQIPVRRPLWLVHKARRGLLPGDEPLEEIGGRLVRVIHRLADEHPDQVSALVSHRDTIQAAWVMLEQRAHSERELDRKSIDKAGMLDIELEGMRLINLTLVPPPAVAAAKAIQ
jgi:uncharacterized phosphatase